MEKILYSLMEYKLLAAIVGFFIIAVETFIPTLPLIVIIVANSFVLGMWLGFTVSWLGSTIAAFFLYFLAFKLSKNKFIIKYKEKEKIQKVINWIKKQGFTTLFVCYVCPFVPDFLITITSGFAQINCKIFMLGMASGKFVMFLLLSYMGKDIGDIFKQPIKIIILIVTIFTFWIVGKKINNKINEN
ncbi:TVP38/TMEM64 family protein [Romboutsia sp.]|uniref:TVP38/TMEM64 family protein n=1 Tax=Romboutsia sp. TaxID=1965302 RepID=UPI003F3F04CC